MTSLFLYLTKTRIPYTFFMLSCLRYYIYNFTKKIMQNLIPTCIIQIILTTYTTSFINIYIQMTEWPFHFLFSCIHMHFSCSPWFFLFFSLIEIDFFFLFYSWQRGLSLYTTSETGSFELPSYHPQVRTRVCWRCLLLNYFWNLSFTLCQQHSNGEDRNTKGVEVSNRGIWIDKKCRNQLHYAG